MSILSPSEQYTEEEVDLLRYCKHRSGAKDDAIVAALNRGGSTYRQCIGQIDALRAEVLLHLDIKGCISVTPDGEKLLDEIDEVS